MKRVSVRLVASLACSNPPPVAVVIGNDFLESLCLETTHNQRLLIWKIREKTFCLIIVRSHVPVAQYAESVEDCLEIIEQSKHASLDLLVPSIFLIHLFPLLCV